jgi:hypothetical protein
VGRAVAKAGGADAAISSPRHRGRLYLVKSAHRSRRTRDVSAHAPQGPSRAWSLSGASGTCGREGRWRGRTPSPALPPQGGKGDLGSRGAVTRSTSVPELGGGPARAAFVLRAGAEWAVANAGDADGATPSPPSRPTLSGEVGPLVRRDVIEKLALALGPASEARRGAVLWRWEKGGTVGVAWTRAPSARRVRLAPLRFTRGSDPVEHAAERSQQADCPRSEPVSAPRVRQRRRVAATCRATRRARPWSRAQQDPCSRPRACRR